VKRLTEWLKQLTRDGLNLRSMAPVINQARMTGDSELWSRVRKLIVDVTDYTCNRTVTSNIRLGQNSTPRLDLKNAVVSPPDWQWFRI